MDVEHQPVYRPQPGDLQRKLAEGFPEEGPREAARAQLLRYGREIWHHEVDRVRLAVLKIADGNLLEINKTIEMADGDYRDVLAIAEYPAYRRLPPGIDPASTAAQEAIKTDRMQYLKWIGDR